MDRLCYITGCGPTIRLGDETVVVRALRIRDYALIESEILRCRGNPFDLLRQAAMLESFRTAESQAVLVALIQEVERRWCRVSHRDLRAWLETWPGRLFGLWLAVRDNDPLRFTFDRVQNLSANLDWCDALRAMEQASAEDERGSCHPKTDWFLEDEGPIPWPTIFRRLATHPYGMTPFEIGELTVNQLQWLLSNEGSDSQLVEFDSAEALASWRCRALQRMERAAANLMQGRRWDA